MTQPLDIPVPRPLEAWTPDIDKQKAVVEYNASILDLEKKLRERTEDLEEAAHERALREEEEAHERAKRRLEIRDRELAVEERDFIWTNSRDRYNHTSGRFVLYDTVDDYSVKSLIQEILQWNSVAPEGDPVKLIINSPGGSVIDGLALYDTLRFVSEESGREVTTVALGYAASMGGVLLQAGDVRLITASSSMLIHEISAGSRGSTGRLKDHMEHIEMLTDRLVEILASKAKLSGDEIRERWDRKDWWLTAQDVVDYGFADRIGNV